MPPTKVKFSCAIELNARTRDATDALFRPDRRMLTYSHVDRIVVGGAIPVATPLPLEPLQPIGAAANRLR